MQLNENAMRVAHEFLGSAARMNVVIEKLAGGSTIIDCGVRAAGGLEAGCRMAEVCLAGLGRVELTDGDPQLWRGPWVRVTTDQPLRACMASQYAGWPLRCEDYFAMGSGPMRAARGREPLFDRIGHLEQPARAVGVLESGQLPGDEVCQEVARQCRVGSDQLMLLVARTASVAGTIQVAARSLETALHKLLELGFDPHRVLCGTGMAPLPPVAADDLTGIGRTNDAVLYGGRVTLWVRGDDDSLQELGPRVPSNSSSDYGRPFAEIFARYERDFYKIDPLLFSPAEVSFANLDTGQWHHFGSANPAVLVESFSR